MRSEIQKLVQEHLTVVASTLANSMADAVTDMIEKAINGKGKPEKAAKPAKAEKKTAKTEKTEKKPAKKERKERDMRCRFVDSEGKRCRKRSKGPRFHFLCEEHIGVKAPKAKPEKAAEEEKPAEAEAATEASA